MATTTQNEAFRDILSETLDTMKKRGEKSANDVCAELAQKHGIDAKQVAEACETLDTVEAETTAFKENRENGLTRVSALKKRLKEIDEKNADGFFKRIVAFFLKILKDRFGNKQ